ncbi:MAG: hypothetical protein ABI411_13605 [Tahibacter sp.]
MNVKSWFILRHSKIPRIVLTRRSASVAILGALSLLIAQAGAQVAIDGHVIAGGGGSSKSAGGCLALDATVGESVVGISSAGSFSLSAGYWAGTGSLPRDSVFNNGFQGCQ